MCAAEPRSLPGRGPATHSPGNFPFFPWGWCTLRVDWASSSSPFAAQAGTRAAEAGVAW